MHLVLDLDFRIVNPGTPEERKDFHNNFYRLSIKTSNSSNYYFDGGFNNIPDPNNPEYYYSNQMKDLNITDYSYDTTTGKLKFSFSYTVAANKSPTGSVLTVSGKVDVIVLEQEGGLK